jgi:RHS repeat-associated protein
LRFATTHTTNNLHAFSRYRFGFNNKEKDDEVVGVGNMYDYGDRMYNPRLGRFFAVDPLASQYPELSPYQFAENNPIQNLDLDGREALDHRFKFVGATSTPKVLNPNAVKVLNMIINHLDAARLTITSTGRTPEQQARIMYENLQAGKSSTYKAPGKQVIQVYHQMKKQGATEEQIKAAMVKKINEVGPQNVSAHTANPQQVNAIDFGIGTLQKDLTPAQIASLKSYLEGLQKAGIISKFLNPENNPGEAAFHIEIKNTPTSPVNAPPTTTTSPSSGNTGTSTAPDTSSNIGIPALDSSLEGYNN